jgi:catechol 2,3-dioxygenase-like lactoylglutathione lyase family enzyme
LKNCKANISAQISWVYTDDLDASTIFYGEVLGFECLRDQGSARIFATVGNAAIGVCRALDERVVEPRGGMISIVTDDVDAWYRRLIDLVVWDNRFTLHYPINDFTGHERLLLRCTALET